MANNLNSILLEGVLKEAPELRTTPKGTQVCTFTLVSRRYYKETTEGVVEDSLEWHEGVLKEEIGYFRVETWGRLAEAVYAKGKKGRGCRVVGRVRQDRWTGVDGKEQSRVVVVAEHVEFRPEFKKDGWVAGENALDGTAEKSEKKLTNTAKSEKKLTKATKKEPSTAKKRKGKINKE